MPDRPSHFIWYELATTDIDAAAAFYGAVIGWSVASSGQTGIDYRLWSIGGETVGGLMAIPDMAAERGMRPVWLGYVDVADVDHAVETIMQAGGSVLMPAMTVPDIGRMAMVTDPQGAAFYVMAPIGDRPSRSFAPGWRGHGGWHELHTTDAATALDFYRAHLGWKPAGTFNMGAMGQYLLFGAGGDAIGGMMNSPGVPRPLWLYYLTVDDIDAAKARVTAAGGTVINGPHEVPTGEWMLHGRDPQGAMFALLGPRKG